VQGKNIEDIYELSPMQKGMLFHFLFDPGSEAYFEQISCTINGPLDEARFKTAWEKVILDHPVFRTSFHWRNMEKPLQVVHRQVAAPWQSMDWSEATAADQEEKLESFLTADRKKGFSLKDAPVMRFTLIRSCYLKHHFIWSHHHILMDGWSIAFVLREVFRYYKEGAADRGRKLPGLYRHYVSWIQGRNHEGANEYWRRKLKGFASPSLIRLAASTDGVMPSAARAAEAVAETSRVRRFIMWRQRPFSCPGTVQNCKRRDPSMEVRTPTVTASA